MNFVVTPSLFHMVLISGERYLAVKNPFLYNTLVTEGRLLAAAALVWFLSVLQQVLSLVDRTIIYRTNFIFSILSIGMIAYCHVRVFIQTRRHALQLAAQQITQEARQKFEKDRKALKLTSVILAVMLVCFTPPIILLIVLLRYSNEVTAEAITLLFSFSVSIVSVNSLVNPIIYVVRIRQFRVAFIQLLFRTVNIAEAEQREMRIFGASNAVVKIKASQDQEVQHERGNINNDNPGSNGLPRHESDVEELNLNLNSS